MQSPADAAPAWQVTGQRESQQVTSAGKLVAGVEVTFHTAQGHDGTIFVTDQDYANLDTVKAQLAAAAAHMDNVGALSAGPG